MANAFIADDATADTSDDTANVMDKKRNIEKTSNNLLGKLFGRTSDATSEVKMLRFFLSLLEVKLDFLKSRTIIDPTTKFIINDVSEQLSILSTTNRTELFDDVLNDDIWNEAYKLERQLALVEPIETLSYELQRRIDEIVEERLPVAPRLQSMYELAKKDAFDKEDPTKLTPSGIEIMRALLQNVLEEHHKHRQKKFGIRPIQRNATNRVVTAVTVSFFLILLPFIWLYVKIAFTGHPPELINWAWLPLYVALVSGLFGAFFSRMQDLQSNWNHLSFGQVRDAMDWRAILFRGAIGMSGALIVYFFLRSGLIRGELFPNFESFGLDHFPPPAPAPAPGAAVVAAAAKDPYRVELTHPSQALALLIIWSFIAGFSERFVPGILTATETSIGTAAATRATP